MNTILHNGHIFAKHHVQILICTCQIVQQSVRDARQSHIAYSF